MKKIKNLLMPAIKCFLFMTVLCGIAYPLLLTGIAVEVFPHQAGGSIVTVANGSGKELEYGSKFIGQEFTAPRYLIGRPMGVSNLSPVSLEQKQAVMNRVRWWHSLDPGNKKAIPADLVTQSGSGVDPNISPKAAEYQVARIAAARGMEEGDVRDIISRCTSKRLMGIWGEPGVNVLEVNLMLDALNER